MNRALWELQEIDNSIARLKRERSKLDDGTLARGERDTLQKAFDEERTHLSGLNASRTDRELQQKSGEEKIARQQSRLMNAKSGHEISALERDLKALALQRSDSDEAILVLMDEIDQSSTRLQELATQLSAKNAEVAQIEAAFQKETTRLESAMDARRAARQTVVAQITDVELKKYSDVAKAHSGVAVARPSDGNCSACGTALTPFNLREAKSQTWPTCENCSRLLFIES